VRPSLRDWQGKGGAERLWLWAFKRSGVHKSKRKRKIKSMNISSDWCQHGKEKQKNVFGSLRPRQTKKKMQKKKDIRKWLPDEEALSAQTRKGPSGHDDKKKKSNRDGAKKTRAVYF